MGLSCTVTMSAAATVTATFNLQTRTVGLTKLGSGNGLVVSTPAGINCGATCSSAFSFGQMVTLTATADPTSVFLGWGGGQCSGIAPCTFMLTSNVTVTANFAVSTYPLLVARAGLGTGRVTSAPAGVDCGSDCSESYPANTMVTLTATADLGSTFGGWSGACTGASTVCLLTMSAAANVVAAFTVGTQPVTVTKTGTGAGTVTSTPAGINCGPTCTASFTSGQGLTLTATASPGSVFGGWSGACTGASTTCVITPNGPTTVFANFAPDTPRLTVTKSGTGAGLVSSLPAGINCGADCNEQYPLDQMVTLTASATPGSEFMGWTGACTGLAACVVTMSTARTVDARFDLGSYQLSVLLDGSGTGSVASLFPGINCGTDCTELYQGNTTVTLIATPGNANMRFSGWSGGGCSGTANCVVTMTTATTVTATFDRIMHPLTVVLAGTGTGSVSSTPAGINCGTTCTFMFPQGQNVALTAVAGPGSTLVSWSGGGCAGFGGCTVPMSGPTTVTATFNLVNFQLTATKSGNGSGTISSAPSGINCGADCSEPYLAGTSVTLTASASVGSTFIQWTGCTVVAGPTCQVTMDQVRSVNAEFRLDTHLLVVGRNGTGTGSVASAPAGISCPSTCTASFNHLTVVTLTPTSAMDSDFVGWSGACTGTGPCVVTMDAAKSTTATFNLKQFALTVTRTTLGGATGTVTSAPAGINCGADCSELFTSGTGVVLTATAGMSSVFGGWSGDCASARFNTTCAVSMAAARNVTATFAELPNRMFVTSTTQTGNLGGLAGADAICRTRALAAGLSGTYVAWLSTSTVNAIDRLASASGWVRVDGRPVFNTRADIVAGASQYRPTMNEFGATSEDQFLHTGTAGNGTATGTLCLDWSTTIGAGVAAGRNRFSGRQWTNGSTNSCAGASPIYCFGVDRQGAAYTPASTNRKAFLSNSLFNPSTGLAAADALCQADATAAGLSGTFLAMLATATASAQSRFNLLGAPWVRVDEVVMAPTPLQFFTSPYWAAGMNMFAGGGIAVSNSAAFSGASTPSIAGTFGSTCTDWTVNTGVAFGGNTDDANVSVGFGGLTLSCAMPRPVYCLQQ
jgi:hypothetical protein